MTPKTPDEFFVTQHELLAKGQFEAANAQLDAMLTTHPGDDRLLHQKMINFAQTQDFERAFAISLTLSTPFKQQPQVTFQIVAIMQGLRNIDISAEVEAEVCRILACPGIDCMPINELVHMLLQHKIAGAQLEPSPLAACDHSRLIHAVLRNFWIVSPGAELLCTDLRKQMLFLLQADPESFRDLSELAVSLAAQGRRNEYAFYIGADEATILDQMASRLTTLCANDRPATNKALPLLLGTLMYRAPGELPITGATLKSCVPANLPVLADFIDADLTERQVLKHYSREFSESAGLTDDTSRAVARMYTENPYPRWVTPEWNTNTQALPYPEFFSLTRCPAWHPQSGNPFRRMLVAGCGTGWHPISHAITFPWLEITAIDISAASLAYARMMAERLGIRNIKFLQADILALDETTLGEPEDRFDIIESIGVLHHLQDPNAGLAILRKFLRADGIIRLGYYSQLARQTIIAFRREHSRLGKSWDADAIRELRHRFLTDDSFARYRRIMEFRDFFSVSGCRDLILHEQESQYTIPELVQILRDNELEFLTFSPTEIHRFNLLGGTGNPYDLSAWQEVEEKEPRLFTGMYQFFAQPLNPAGA